MHWGGWALVRYDGGWHVASGPRPGRQTAPLAELAAPAWVGMAAGHGALLISDCTYTMDGLVALWDASAQRRGCRTLMGTHGATLARCNWRHAVRGIQVFRPRRQMEAACLALGRESGMDGASTRIAMQ